MTELERKIALYLDKKEINCALDGYRYLIEAISFTITNPSATSIMYCTSAACRYHVNLKQVETSISYALRTKPDKPKKFIHEAAKAVRMMERHEK